MRLVSKLSIATGVIALATVPFAYAVGISQYYITPDNSSGWTMFATDRGTTAYVDDAPAGFGAASLQLNTSSSFYDKVALGEWTDIPVNELTQLGYWAKQGVVTNLKETVNLEFDIDIDGDFATDTTIVYKPSLQNGGTFIQNGVWEHYDAVDGQFLSTRNYGTGASALVNNGTLYNLSQLKQWYPTARVKAVNMTFGDNLQNSSAQVDGITIGSSVYDVEKVVPTTPEVVNVPKTIQDCKKYGWESLLTADGNTFKNQGQCVSYIVSSKAKLK